MRVFNRILVTLNGVEFDSGKNVSRTHQYGPENVFVGAIFGPMEIVDRQGRGLPLHGVDAGIDMDKLNDVITESERRLSETSQRRAAEKRRSNHRGWMPGGPIGSLATGIAHSVRKMKKTSGKRKEGDEGSTEAVRKMKAGKNKKK